MNGNFRSDFLQKIFMALDTLPIADQTVSTVAGKCGCSVWHTQRVFHALTGQSLGHYIRARKLTAAAQLLNESSLSILDIALHVGFSSHEAFTRSFQSYFGESPKKHRMRAPKRIPLAKPRLTDDYLKHLKNMSLEPTITTRPELHLVGLRAELPSPFVSTERPNLMSLQPVWHRFFPLLDTIPFKKQNSFIGFIESESGTNEDETFMYLAACEVEKASEVSLPLSTLVVPSQTYAVFTNVGGGSSTIHLVDYIYGSWLPQSGRKRAPGCDFETFDQTFRFMNANSTSFYHLPLET